MDQASKLLTERTLRQKTEKQSFFLFIFFFPHSLCVVQKGNTEIQQGSLRHLFALIWNMAEL